ncbi:MAG: haloacid dehalogenase type II [Nocardioides sp.]
MNRPRVIVFDVNQTLSDLAPLADRFGEVGAPSELATAWFAGLLRDGIALAATGEAAPFADIARAELEWVLRPVVGEEALPGAVGHVLDGLGSLGVHPDVVDGVRALRNRDIELVTLSNGAAAVAEGLFERAGIRDQFSRLLSVEDAGVWKPAAAAYEYALSECGVSAHDAMLVAVHPWDIHGAARAGLRTAWLNRNGAAYPAHFARPELSPVSLVGLAAAVD